MPLALKDLDTLDIDRAAELVENDAFWREQGVEVKAAVRPIFRELLLTGAAIAIDNEPSTTKALDVDFDEIAAIADEVVDTYLDDWWLSLEETQRSALRGAIVEARSFGKTPAFVAERINGLFAPSRTARIAITETTNLIGRGAQESYRRAGFPGWIWRTVNDGFVDPTCAALEAESDPRQGGSPFPASRPFSSAHPNCRCWPVPAGDVVVLP